MLRTGRQQPMPALHDVRHGLGPEQFDWGRGDHEPQASWNLGIKLCSVSGDFMFVVNSGAFKMISVPAASGH